MAINDINIGTNITPPASGIPSKADNPAPVAPKITVQNVHKVVEQRKDSSVKKLEENAVEIREAVAEINKAMKKVPTSLDFSVDEASKRFIVSVTDTDTGEVIRKLPGDAVLRIAKQLESLKGIVFDQKF
jgi:flagellar protein FlaG